MKKQMANLSKAQLEKVEADYHRMKPEKFDKLMSRAKRNAGTSTSRCAIKN